MMPQVELLRAQHRWTAKAARRDQLTYWIDAHFNKLAILSFVSGSSFAAIELMNSHLFASRVVSPR